ncbi:MAG: ORC-CDC6 family AAA ATPase [Solirubrobacteraceae bacterium]
MLSPMNRAFLGLQRRAEQGDPAFLVQTFVDVGPLFALLSSRDHQILYGRRGTGKTHAMQYLRASVDGRGEFAAYIDLRTIGSAGGIYDDQGLSISERGTRLVSDVLTQLVERLTDYLLELAESGQDVTPGMRLIERLEDAAVDVRVVGEHETESRIESAAEHEASAEVGASLDAQGPALRAGIGSADSSSDATSSRERVRGVERHHVHFGEVSSVLGRLVIPFRLLAYGFCSTSGRRYRSNSSRCLRICLGEPYCPSSGSQ